MMKGKYRVNYIALRRYIHDLRRKKKKRLVRRKRHEQYLALLQSLDYETSIDNILKLKLSESTKYLFSNVESPLSFEKIMSVVDNYEGVVEIPNVFSLIEKTKESFEAIKMLTASLLFQKHSEVVIDYSQCKRFTLEAQVLLDLILKDILRIYDICERIPKNRSFTKAITDKSKKGSNVRTMLFSVGSQAIHANRHIEYPNIIPYHLCMHRAVNNSIEQIEQKELDTTSLSDYVEKCLARMGRKLDDDSMDNLCTVIGEILINAEEHSSTHCRYSIGYFEQKVIEGREVGVFQLVILNMGRSIYEKFHDNDCPNQDVVEKMKTLSSRYTRRRFWQTNKFDEETLWTLYSLQDGVTSVSPQRYSQRGNGSLRFIESFFNLKNVDGEDKVSKMVLQSGHSNIVFDGTYGTAERMVNNHKYRVMTFNESNDIEEAPDTKFVRHTDFYFPGTFIYANIIL